MVVGEAPCIGSTQALALFLLNCRQHWKIDRLMGTSMCILGMYVQLSDNGQLVNSKTGAPVVVASVDTMLSADGVTLVTRTSSGGSNGTARPVMVSEACPQHKASMQQPDCRCSGFTAAQCGARCAPCFCCPPSAA